MEVIIAILVIVFVVALVAAVSKSMAPKPEIPRKENPSPPAKQEQKHQLRKLLKGLPSSFVVLDFETTGLYAGHDQIIEVGAVKFNIDDPENIKAFGCLIKPKGRRITKSITEITGITPEMVKQNGQDHDAVISELHQFIGGLTVVAYNAPFDMRFLKCSYDKLGFPMPNQVICALERARESFPDLENHKLATVAESLGIDSSGAHRAIDDCMMTLKVLLHASHNEQVA